MAFVMIKPKMQIGDTVTVSFNAIVDAVDADQTHSFDTLVYLEDGRTLWVRPSEIVKHTPKPVQIKVGHRVKRGQSDEHFLVKAIVGDEAWIHSDKVFDRIVKLSELTVVGERA